ncbi:MAG: GNAT family N-acetyltransferase, partial [Balneolaceae bacterium]|nr:GNAT family N-acetyltransferase [Balneolaceae bacterium]
KIDQEVQIVRDIFNKSWSENWGFIPLTENELSALADDLKMILDPKFAHIAEVDGKPIAFSVALPDLNQALRHMNGRLFPTGVFKLLWHKRKIDQVRTALMGVIPEYRGKGIDALLHLKAIENGRKEGVNSSELSWVLETNTNMIRVAERLGAHIEKTYRLYRKSL